MPVEWSNKSFPIETDGTPAEPLVREFIEAVVSMNKQGMVDLMHPDCIVEYPMAMPGFPTGFRGRDAFEEFESLSFSVTSRKFTNTEL
ncbi:nuclear transport factor 2 family protein, partial [Rhodococcus koreensis]